MQRRNFMKTAAAGAALSMLNAGNVLSDSNRDRKIPNGEFLLPKVLNEGDTIGVIAPGTAVTDPDDIAKARAAADYFGLKIKLGNNVLSGSGYKSRSVKERVDDLHDMFADPDIKAVFCLRGGYGSAQLLGDIDYKLIRDNPKIFIGYSDITAMHLAINKFSRLVTFHGPVLLSSFSSYTTEHFRKALFDTDALGILKNPNIMSGIRKAYPIRTISPGTARGKLVGGNMTLISTTMGTPYEIDTKDRILFIEDVGEQPYSIDRMMTQLALAGKFRDAAGIIVGKCAGCNDKGLNPSKIWDNSIGEIFDYHLGKLNIPVVSGMLIGHTSEQLTLPLGVNVELNADLGEIRIDDACVRD